MFIITSLVLIIPTVVFISEGQGSDGFSTQTCTTKGNGDGTTTQTCTVPTETPELVGIAYALMSVSAGVAAVAFRPDGGLTRRLAGQPGPFGAAPPFPPQGQQPQAW